MYNVAMRRVRATIVAAEEQYTLHYSECVCVCVCVFLGIQHEMCMRRIVMCGLYGDAVFFHMIS
jgi:hypothetical protein